MDLAVWRLDRNCHAEQPFGDLTIIGCVAPRTDPFQLILQLAWIGYRAARQRNERTPGEVGASLGFGQVSKQDFADS